MDYKWALSLLAIALTFTAFLPYGVAIIRGEVRPHVFSWVIWGSTTFAVFLAQFEDGGGVGAWPIGVSGCITLGIALLAYLKRGDVSITKVDWLFFAAAMSALPFWYFTANPLWAVVILTTVDMLGFGPTARKVWHRPHSESLLFFSLFLTRNLMVIAALEHHSLTTVLFPAVIACGCALLIGVIIYRRRMLIAGGGDPA